MKVYDANLNLIKSFQAHTSSIIRIKQSPFNNSYVATCSDDKTVKIWKNSNWNLIQTYTKHTQYVVGLEWINKETIASGSNDKTIHIWSISTGQTQRIINTGSSAYVRFTIITKWYSFGMWPLQWSN